MKKKGEERREGTGKDGNAEERQEENEQDREERLKI